MFERSFSWSMRNGPRLILSIAAVMLLAGLFQFYRIMTLNENVVGTPEYFFLVSVTPAALLLFGALLVAKPGRHVADDLGQGDEAV
jgi:hypothetical protein